MSEPVAKLVKAEVMTTVVVIDGDDVYETKAEPLTFTYSELKAYAESGLDTMLQATAASLTKMKADASRPAET